jgi:hypothetical protein
MNTKETQATARPWRAGTGPDKIRAGEGDADCVVATFHLPSIEPGTVIAEFERMQANRAITITAVNEHEALCRVAEAAEKLGAKLEEYAHGSGNKRKSDWAMEMLAARDSLDASLAALSTLRAANREEGK